jgi:hypothetical protein
VSFALNKKTRARLLKQLEKHNDNLEKLLCSSDRIASSQSRRPSQVPSKLRNIYKQARGLSSALKKGWQCSCQHYHSSNILLEDRTSSSPPARRSSLVSDSISLQFAILFHYGQVPAPWIWHEVEIKVSQAEATLPVLPTSPTLASSTLSPSSTFSSGAVTLRR